MDKAKAELRAKQLEALTLKRYKVGVVTMGLHNFTVTATDPQAAVDKVMKDKGSRDAGKEGPMPFGFRVQDMSIIGPSVTLQQIMQEFQSTTAKPEPAQDRQYLKQH